MIGQIRLLLLLICQNHRVFLTRIRSPPETHQTGGNGHDNTSHDQLTKIYSDDLCGGRCDDPSCDDSPLCLGTERSPARCQDGRDNDDDGLTDCLDSDCSDNPRVDFCGDETDGPRCSDVIDNDGDGFTDCESPVCIELPECLETTVRIVAANLTSGGTQTYDPGHGLRILEGLRGDILLIQEFQYGDNSPAALQTFANQACGETCRAHRGGGDTIPNGIVSRYPILAAGSWRALEPDSRDFAWARIDVPGDRDLWAVSLHLLTSSGAEREREAADLIDYVEADVPAGDLLVIGGDFNVGGGPVFDRLSARVVIATLPTDQLGNRNTNAPRSRVLDALFVSSALQARQVPVEIGAASFMRGLVVDTRVFTPIEDLAPALESDSGAPSMQHMAIVRDFQVGASL